MRTGGKSVPVAPGIKCEWSSCKLPLHTRQKQKKCVQPEEQKLCSVSISCSHKPAFFRWTTMSRPLFHFCNPSRPSWKAPIQLRREVAALHRTTTQPPTPTTSFNLTPTWLCSYCLNGFADVQFISLLWLLAFGCWETRLRQGGREEWGWGPKKPKTVNEISKMLQHVRSFWRSYYILSVAVRMCKIGLCTGVAAWLRDLFSFVLPIYLCKRLDTCGPPSPRPPCRHRHEIGSAGDAQRYGLCHAGICRGADKRRWRSRIKRIWRRCSEIVVGFMPLTLPLGCVLTRVWLQSHCVADGLLFQSFPCQSL